MLQTGIFRRCNLFEMLLLEEGVKVSGGEVEEMRKGGKGPNPSLAGERSSACGEEEDRILFVFRMLAKILAAQSVPKEVI